jgi:hypothetical protein
MLTSVALIGAVTILEAKPVYGYLRSEAFGGDADPVAMIIGFGIAGLLCTAATLVPVEVALRRLERGES